LAELALDRVTAGEGSLQSDEWLSHTTAREALVGFHHTAGTTAQPGGAPRQGEARMGCCPFRTGTCFT